MTKPVITTSPAHPGLTLRTDWWWLSPLLILVGGAVAGLYATWAAFQNAHYTFGPYTSPIYSSPVVPEWWTISPAFLLIWIPIGFRLTCYYGRKAYYRGAFADPAQCAVEEPHRKHYYGESRFPFILHNLHRYFLYAALALLALHWYEWGHSVWDEGKGYLGVGTLLLLLDTAALTMYVGGCHSLRHWVGGGKRCPSGGTCSCSKSISHHAWKKVSLLNQFHNVWFWVSLYTLIIADIYIRLLSMGIIPYDPHIMIFG